jgi:hypothetical protein
MSAANVHVDAGGTGTAVGLNLGLGGSVDLDGTLLQSIGVGIDIKPLPVIKLDPINVNASVAVTQLPPIVTHSDVALDLKVAVTHLPKIELEFGFKPMRIHFPTHYQFCFSILGKEVFKFGLCGESMVACEPYHPHETEKCG